MAKMRAMMGRMAAMGRPITTAPPIPGDGRRVLIRGDTGMAGCHGSPAAAGKIPLKQRKGTPSKEEAQP